MATIIDSGALKIKKPARFLLMADTLVIDGRGHKLLDVQLSGQRAFLTLADVPSDLIVGVDEEVEVLRRS
jgi:hypothetical protein